MAWETLGEDIIAETPRFDLIKERVRLPNGQIRDAYLTRHADSAVIMPITPDKKIIILNEYRHPCRRKLLSLVGGHLEEGDTPASAAERELLEETGFSAEKYEFVQSIYPDPPRTGRQWHFFIAHNARQVAQQMLTETEDIEVLIVSPDELLEKMACEELTDLPSMGLAYLGLHKLGYIRYNNLNRQDW